MNKRRHANENLRTAFEGSGRFAGIGAGAEDYSEESFPDHNPWAHRSVLRRVPKRQPEPEPEPVTVYKLSEEELKKYRSEVG